MAGNTVQQNIVLKVQPIGINPAINSLAKLDALALSLVRDGSKIGKVNKILTSSFSGINNKLSSNVNHYRQLTGAYRDMYDTFKSANNLKMRDPAAINMANTLWVMQQARPQIAALGTTAESAALGVNILQGSFFRLRAIMYTVISIVFVLGAAFKKWFEVSSDYAEANHLLYATLYNSLMDTAQAQEELTNGMTRTMEVAGLFKNSTLVSKNAVPNSVAQGIEDISNKLNYLASIRGLDPTQFKRTYATFYEMANAAGMSADNIDAVAEGMTKLSYDIASLYDMDFQDVAANMRSALGGITQAVRKYGMDVSRTAADSWLAANGFDVTYNSLDRASKMAVIFNMAMEKMTTAQDDLGQSIAQPANQLRILGEQARVAARSLGAALFPLLTPLISAFIGVAQAVAAFGATLQSVFGAIFGSAYTDAAASWNDFFQNLSFGGESGLADLAEDMDDVSSSAGGAAGAAKELKKQLMGFDEINNITPDTDTGGGGGGGGGTGGGAGINIPIADVYPWIEDAMDKIKSNIAVADWGAPFKLAFFNGLVKAVKELNAAKIVEEIAKPFAKMEGLGKPFAKLAEIFGKISKTIGNLGAAFKQVTGFDKIFSPAVAKGAESIAEGVEAVGKGVGILSKIKIIPVLGWILGTVDVLLAIPKYIEAITNGTMTMADVLADAFMKFTGLDIFKTLGEGLSGEREGKRGGVEFAENMMTSVIQTLIGAIPTVLAVIGEIVMSIPGAVLNVAGTLLSSLGTIIGSLLSALAQNFRDGIKAFFDNPGAFIESAMQMGGDIIKGLLDGIETFLSGIGDFFYNIFVVPIKTLLGINSPSTLFAEYGTYIIEGLCEGINSVISFVTDIFTNLINGISLIFTTWVSFIQALLTGDFKGAFQIAKDFLVNMFNGLKTILTAPFNFLVDTVSSVVSKIKGFLNFKWDLPSLPLPHLTISPEGWKLDDLFTGGGLPSLGVRWYAKGGIIDTATLGVLGEAGTEAVIPMHGAAMLPFAETIGRQIANYSGTSLGTTQTVEEANVAQVALLQEQNELLRMMLDKDTSIEIDGVSVAKAMNRVSRVQGRALMY